MKTKINKRILFLVVLLLAIAGSVYGMWLLGERKYTGNLVSNFSFEVVDTQGKLQSWREDASGGWSVNTEEPYEGKRCVQATIPWSWLSQDISVREGKSYTLKAYVKSDIVIPGKSNRENTFLCLECLDGKDTVMAEQMRQFEATSSWKPQKVSIYAPENTEKIRVKLAKRRGGEGRVWFDNLKMVQIAWYMRIEFLKRLHQDKRLFISYFSMYLIPLILLLRFILRK